MRLFYFAASTLLALPGTVIPTCAQARPASDSTQTLPSPWLLKGGLRLTHLTCSRTSTSWQVVVPVALAVERRVSSRFSLYAQLDTDVQLASTSVKRRKRSSVGTDATFPVAGLALGARCYYGRPVGPTTYPPTAPEFGKYLALEAGASVAQAPTRLNSASRGFAGSRSLLTPSLYVLWGIQNRLRPHLLYDLNAGPGLLAPTRTAAEYYLPSHGWDVGVQANVRLYWGN